MIAAMNAMNVWTFLLLLGLIHWAHSKGGRSSFRGGSSYRSSTSYRSSSRYRSTNPGTWSTSQKAAALTLGAIYISSRMRTRYGSPGYYNNHDVRICRNVEKYPEFNGSTTVYGWFLCPIEIDENSYCCGSSDKEYCCDFWSSTEAIGAYIGFALLGVGIIAGAIVLFICFIKPKLFKKPRPMQSQVENSPVSFSNQPGAGATIGASDHPPQYTYSNPVGPGMEEMNQNTKGGLYPQQQYGVYPPQQYNTPAPSYSACGGAAPA